MKDLLSGVAINTLHLEPLHGLRHPPTEGTTGWFVWGGDWSSEADFFQPWHTRHLLEHFPHLTTLLQLPPGSRWLTDGKFTDTWFDESLLAAK